MNIVPHPGTVTRERRERLLGQRGCVIWLTGLSGSGKSTIARAVEDRLIGARKLAYVLDGDNIRHGLSSDLGFSAADREENIRRIGEVSALFADAGLIVIVAFISPYRKDRDVVRQKIGSERFLEVFIDAPLETCEARDTKGLYRRARAGEVPEFTGISAPYEPPSQPDLVLDTARRGVDACAEQVDALLRARFLLSPPAES